MPQKDCTECKHYRCADDGDGRMDIWCKNPDQECDFPDFNTKMATQCTFYELKPEIRKERGIEWLTSICALTMKSHQHILRGMFQRCCYLLNLAPAEEQKYRMLAHLTKTEQLIHKTMEKLCPFCGKNPLSSKEINNQSCCDQCWNDAIERDESMETRK
jgi:hypothetical protein